MHHCNICHTSSDGVVEEASVRSNVRKFRNEQFRLWRCPQCLSIHASDDVDLAHYYRDYPFHHVGNESEVDWMLQGMYRKQWQRLRAAGLQPEHAVLDYGCGGGAFVKFLRAQGYQNVQGYDEYSNTFGDKRVLEAQYDMILTQDVLEHVAEPWDMLRMLSKLLAPRGAVAIGTPNAEAIDLQHPEARVHTLHQPYHRHIFSKRVLMSLGDQLDWELVQYYPTMYSNTGMPFANQRFLLHYFQACDDTVDLVAEPIQVKNPKLYSPVTLFWGLFGSFYAAETDVMAIYRKRG